MEIPKLYQNDFPHLPEVEKEGCLFMTLVRMVSKELQVTFRPQDIDSLYARLNPDGILGSENSRDDYGAFVWSHEGVLDGASAIAGFSGVKWGYLAKIYMPQEISKGHTDYIPDLDYWKNATSMAFQIQTEVGGHFRGFDYDPWKYGTVERYLKSIRYYRRIS